MERIPLFDAHCDSISYFLTTGGESLTKSGGHLELERVKGFAPYAQFFALFAVMAFLTFKIKLHPILIICISAAVGIAAGFLLDLPV